MSTYSFPRVLEVPVKCCDKSDGARCYQPWGCLHAKRCELWGPVIFEDMWGGSSCRNVSFGFQRRTTSVPLQPGEFGKQYRSPVLADCGCTDQAPFRRKNTSQGFRKELVDAFKAALDVPRPPQHRRGPQDCTVDPHRASIRELAVAAAALVKHL